MCSARARLIYALDRFWVFTPERGLVGTPQHVGLEYEDVWLTAADGVRLHGWWMAAAGANGNGSAPTVLFCHGKGGNISTQLGDARVITQSMGANLLLFDYRGYGQSDGSPTEKGVELDARAALEYLKARVDVDPRRIVYFGRSLGGGVATRLAELRAPAALILESAFPNIPKVAAHQHKRQVFRHVMSRLLLRTRFDTARRIKRVHCPVLVAHGEADDLIDISLGREVYDAAGEPRIWHSIPGAGHNDMFETGGEKYHRLLREFIFQHAGPGIATSGRPIAAGKGAAS